MIQPGVAQEQKEYTGTGGMRDDELESIVIVARLAAADEAPWE